MQVHPARAEEKIGFLAVRTRIVEACHSASGADRASRLAPLADADEARRILERVDRLQELLRFGDPMPEASFEPVDEFLGRAAPAGSFLEPEELSAVRRLAACARRLRSYLVARTLAGSALAAVASSFVDLPDVERAIDDLLDVEGRIREDASPVLRRVRREAAQTRERLRLELLATLRRAGSEGWATEDQPTIRGGRMVLPIRAEAKRKLEGIVHDVSSTGLTVYVEPAACVELNNDLRSLEAEERREIVRLLTAVTSVVRERRHDLASNAESLTTVDVLVATARVANRLDARVPDDLEEGRIDLRSARHPELLLRAVGSAAPVVPLDLELGGETRLLVISGPNAGGKSVALKTIGLFATLLAAGIPIPCDAGSRFDRFDRLFIEIGDDQSVEDDLSTFSSHLAHLRQILREADDRSLVLIDEAGSGTDPDEGAALAQAVLEALLARGARCLVTTHQGPLKRFAHEADGAANGMMAFDRESLRPTFRFVAGVPGASYAFEIADRLGLDPEVIQRAQALVGSDRFAMERLLADLDERNRNLEIQLVRATGAADAAESRRALLEERVDSLQRARQEIRDKALSEADAVLREANAAVEKAVREIRESQADRETVKTVREELENTRETLKNRRVRGERRSPRVKGAGKARPTAGTAPLAVGDQVRFDDSGTTGELVELRDHEALVTMGSARIRVALERITKVGGRRRQEVTVRQVSDAPSGWVASRARLRIDLRGRRVDEALSEVVHFVDEAVAAGLDRVEILHGKGTGALRLSIHEYLSSRPDVSSFDEASAEQGGAGVTVVLL